MLKKYDLVKIYQDMLLIRRFEERAGQLYGMGLIGGFCHLYIGQEAVVTGMQANALPEDSIITAYRDHGHMLACGMHPDGVMAELTGRAGGYSKGKGGSMHMCSKEKNFFGGHGIVGAQVPLGTGLAFAHKYKKDGGINLAYMGDGAANQGQVYESFNMAALWGLPVLYIIENNLYGMGTSSARACAGDGLYKRGEAFGIPGEVINGMDVREVLDKGGKAMAYVRENSSPMLLEMRTYRYKGHSMSDPATYRSKDELDNHKNIDPIKALADYLVKNKHATTKDLEAIEKAVKTQILQAAEFAKTAPLPDPTELYTDVTL